MLFFKRTLLMEGGWKYPPGISRLTDEKQNSNGYPPISMTAIGMAELPDMQPEVDNPRWRSQNIKYV